MQNVALEGRMFVLSANQYATRSDYPPGYHTEDGSDPVTDLIGGGSCLVGTHGRFLAEPDRSGETILTAELDLGEATRGMFDFDPVSHWARPDVFQLAADGREKDPVVTGEIE
jgi:nitrilase